MITQSQYFDIEDYLQQECRIIEPRLLEEMIDHFMDGIEGVKQSDDDFIAAFEAVKGDFGGKAGVRKIQRAWQLNALKVYAKGIAQEIETYFQKPFWWRTFLGCLFIGAFLYFFSFRFIGWEKPYMLIGGFAGGVSGIVLTVFSFLYKNKSDFGFYGLQARNWFSILMSISICLLALIYSLITYFFRQPAFVIPLTVVFVLLSSLLFIAVFRYSNRELYPEYA